MNLLEGEKASLSLEVRPVIPAEREADYASFMAAVPQANQMARKVGGWKAMFIPTLDKLRLIYPRDEGQELVVLAGTDARHYRADKQGVITIPFDRSLIARGARVQLTHLPAEAELSD